MFVHLTESVFILKKCSLSCYVGTCIAAKGLLIMTFVDISNMFWIQNILF